MRVSGRFGCTLVVACMSLAVAAMPSKADFQKVKPAVDELLGADREAVKAGKMKPGKAGENAVRLAEQSKDEASKYMFWQAAFSYFVKEGAFDQAYNAVMSLRSSVKDIPHAEMVRVLKNGLRGTGQQNVGKLYELLRETENLVRYARERDQIAKNLVRRPADAALRMHLAERYALLGDWKKALPEFAKGAGDVAKAAKAELGQGTLAPDKIADIWWGYAVPGEESTRKCFRAHAAEFYGKALEEGGLDGIRRSLVEKRVKEVGVQVGQIAGGSESKVFRITDNLARLYFDGTNYVEFVKCPAGEFNMTTDFKARKTAKVRITRPFWIMKEEATIRLAYGSAFKPGKPGSEKIPAWRRIPEIDDLAQRLMNVCGDELPEGCVVRLPTNAELQYALCGGDSRLDTKRMGRENAWNIVAKQNQVWTLDRFAAGVVQRDSPSNWGFGRFPKLDSTDDPFGWTDKTDGCGFVVWRTAGLWNWLEVPSTEKKFGAHFRLVIGPDLVGEWRKRNGKE